VIDRRSFICATASTLVAIPLRAYAERKQPRIGLLTPGPNPRQPAFWEGMRDLGYVDGKTIVVERRSAEGDYARLPALAVEIVKGQPDVIVAIASTSAIAAKQATVRIPIVMVGVSDPVAAGLVGNLARPGGNVTGTSTQSSATVGKLLEIMRQMLPRTRRVAALWDPVNAIPQQLGLGESLIAAARLQLLIRVIEVRTREDLELAFAGLQSEPADAMLIYSDTFFLAHAERIANLAIAKRLPVFSTRRPFAEAGILASYGAELDVLGRRSAAYVQRILNGAKPGDLSVELPTKFSLTINLKTAKALDLTIPQWLLLRADEVIR